MASSVCIVPSRRRQGQRLKEGLVQTGYAFFQPGKEYSLCLFPQDPAKLDTLYDLAIDTLGPLSDSVDLLYSRTCLNIFPHGFHKGKGIEFLADYTGIVLEEMLGVGDSDVDRPFLAKVGYSAAPANANQDIKQLVQYVAPRSSSQGVRDILDHFGLMP